MFITSKVWNTFHSYELAKKCVDEILADLSLDYLDLCLIHWPHGYEEGGDIFPKVRRGAFALLIKTFIRFHLILHVVLDSLVIAFRFFES